MKRGDVLVIPHVTEKLEVTFSDRGIFSLTVTGKNHTRAHGLSGGFTSLSQFAEMLQYYFEPRVGYVYQHINGNVYKVIAIANQESKRADYPPTVVYQDTTNGKVWAKSFINFIAKMTRIK